MGPNELRVAEITYIVITTSFVYLAVIQRRNAELNSVTSNKFVAMSRAHARAAKGHL